MNQDKITIKVSKENPPNYQRNTSTFESISYQKAGEGPVITHLKSVGSFLESLPPTITRWGKHALKPITGHWLRITITFLVKGGGLLLGNCLVMLKDLLMLVYYLVIGSLKLLFTVLAGAFTSSGRTTHPLKTKTKAKHYQPPIDDEWWRRKPRPKAAKKKRVIRVIVEVEE
ncbi:hypothetical protein [Lewinella cohaerens]|uniref:hypothetical protein n=1 Tax=Lewinella cohaerens TaxID=70995 RepID=UPI000361272C|nr:hypothetical protein [Lewinella cohaerens]